MKPFNKNLSLKIDRALSRYEASRGLLRLWRRLQLWHAEREAMG